MARPAPAVGLAVVVLLVGACSSSADDPMAFCDALRDASASTSAVATLDIDDAATLDAAMADLGRVQELAPAEISADVDVVADVYTELLSALAATAPGAQGEVLRSMQARLDEAAAPALALERYGRDRCSVSFEAPAAPTPTPTPLDIDD